MLSNLYYSDRIGAIREYKNYPNIYTRLKSFALNLEADAAFYEQCLELFRKLSVKELSDLERDCTSPDFDWTAYFSVKLEEQAERDRARLFHDNIKNTLNPHEELEWYKTSRSTYILAVVLGILAVVEVIIFFCFNPFGLGLENRLLFLGITVAHFFVPTAKIISDRRNSAYIKKHFIPAYGKTPAELQTYRENDGNVTLFRR